MNEFFILPTAVTTAAHPFIPYFKNKWNRDTVCKIFLWCLLCLDIRIDTLLVFLDRIYEECLTYEGELDYKSYLDFVLAYEYRQEPASIQYFFKVILIRLSLNKDFSSFWTLTRNHISHAGTLISSSGQFKRWCANWSRYIDYFLNPSNIF